MASLQTGTSGSGARVMATAMGQNADTSFTQPTHDTEAVGFPFEGNATGELPMVADRNNYESRDRVRWKGLTIDTKLGQDFDGHTGENNGTSVNAWRATKASNTNMPRLSEAMMNRDWRSHRRSPGEESQFMMESIWSAPPERSKFPDLAKDKPQRYDDTEVPNYDHGLERVAYRSVRPEEVKPELIPFTMPGSVSAELCLSAPATKLEFSEAEMGGEERSKKYDPSVFQPSVKSIVRLDTMEPTKRAGYEKIIGWDEQYANLGRGKLATIQESSTITSVTPIDASMDWESVRYPYAEIRAVQGNKKFETGLSHFEETIRKQLSTLVEPQTAGLPPDYLRKEYEERREERRKAVAVAFANSTAQANSVQNRTEVEGEAQIQKGTDDAEFNVLLGRLNKLCAPRLRAYTVGETNKSPRFAQANEIEKAANGTEKVANGIGNLTKIPENPVDTIKYTANGNAKRSPSIDSGISVQSSTGRMRSSTLNPEAVEFQIPTQQEKASVDDGGGLTVSSPSASVAKVEQASPKTADPILKLETRVAELEAQLARQISQAQSTRQKSGGKAKHAPHGAMEHGFAGPRGSHHAMNNRIMGPAGYQVVQPIPPYIPQPQPGFVTTAGVMPMNAMPAMAQYGPAEGAGIPYNGMPVGFNAAHNGTQVAAPFQGAGGVAAAGPGSSVWVKSMFGPKPVSKPNRPFQPGDGVQAVRQQQYEEYLEHLRATDPSYALRCKQRQARRADRQRTSTNGNNGLGSKEAY